MDNPLPDNPTPQVEQKLNRRDRAGEQIKHYIRSRRLPPGDLLPPVRALAEHFGVSRDAAWRALRELQDEGWISARANRRYEIAKDVYTRILGSLKVKALFTGGTYIRFSGFRRLADSLKQECHHHNMELSISLLPIDKEPDDSVWEGCDVLLIDADSSPLFLKHFKKFKVPVIGLDAEYSNRYHLNIVTDHYAGGRLAAERLIRNGSRKACIVHFEKPPPRIQARVDGFRQVWLESGKPESSLATHEVKWSHNSFEVALNVSKDLHSFNGGSDLFITDGKLAVTYLDILDYLKVSVPEDVRLIGYDGAQMGGTTNPPMTAIQQDMDLMARTAANRIGECTGSHSGNTEVVRIPPHLIERISG
jgi:DNA-binding LacI/PurR family transcriptional regulator